MVDSEARENNMNTLVEQLKKWLDIQSITSNTIGNIRRQCCVPWDSEWNSIVRDETAKREVNSDSKPQSLADMYQKSGGVPVKKRYSEEIKERNQP